MISTHTFTCEDRGSEDVCSAQGRLQVNSRSGVWTDFYLTAESTLNHDIDWPPAHLTFFKGAAIVAVVSLMVTAEVVLPFYGWRDKGTDRVSDFPRSYSQAAGIETQAFLLECYWQMS